MIKYIVIILLVILILILLINEKTQDPMLDEIKRRYNVLIESLKGDPEFKRLVDNRAIITNKPSNEDGTIAFNVNKGYEIHICLDGKKINGAMYVLLHELAHITVEEYDHSESFWSNFKKLRERAIDIGVYSPEYEVTYCGETIRDSLAVLHEPLSKVK